MCNSRNIIDPAGSCSITKSVTVLAAEVQASAMSEPETKYYSHGRFALQGGTLPDTITAYRTYGDPSNPCIVFPTCYGGRLDSE